MRKPQAEKDDAMKEWVRILGLWAIALALVFCAWSHRYYYAAHKTSEGPWYVRIDRITGKRYVAPITIPDNWTEGWEEVKDD
ncbi:MAG: hypothetical protein ABSF52_24730 [Syntrophobacteraceae bacterium]